MPDITVHRHGNRWAVVEAGAESPVKEYETRKEAELAARGLAEGGTVKVREDDPTGLDRVEDPDTGQPAPTGAEDRATVSARERARSTQTGL